MSLVSSKLDYGCILYGTARKSYLQMLDHVQELFSSHGGLLTNAKVVSAVISDNHCNIQRNPIFTARANAVDLTSFPPKYFCLYEKQPKSIKIIWHQIFFYF